MRGLVALGLSVAALATLSGTLACASSTESKAAAPRASSAPPEVKAQSGILIDRRSGVVLWSKAMDRRLQPLSCAKIMTALLVLEHVKDLQAYARVPSAAYPQRVVIELRPGDRITIWQALRALMVKSANDAAITLACYVAGDEGKFAKMMNARGAQLGLENTRFENCRGKPVPGQYSSARDLAVLGRFAMRDPRFRRLVKTRSAVIHWPPAHRARVTSHNRLLEYPWGDGIKTGANPDFGMVLVGSGQPGLEPLIVVTMLEPDRDREERDAVALFDWGSALFERRTVVRAGAIVRTLPVTSGGFVGLAAQSTLSVVVRKVAPVTVQYSLPAMLTVMPADGFVVGSATYHADAVRLGSVKLVAAGPATSSPGTNTPPR